MNLVCGVDFETNGTDFATLNITEIGAVLRNPVTKEVIERFSTLVWDESYPPQPEHIVALTGITDDDLRADSMVPRKALDRLTGMIAKAQYAMAYNKIFDETVYKQLNARVGCEMMATVPWVCAYTEVPYPDKFRCRQLSHLALDHGIKMDGRDLHRADADVDLMFELTDLYPWEEILKYKNEPWVTVQAIIPAPWTDNGVGKAAATSRGYGWEKARGTDAPTFPKMWVKRIKEGALTKETSEAPFRIVKLT